jgi:CubicO group peptidase (beta-lactamase class C family)
MHSGWNSICSTPDLLLAAGVSRYHFITSTQNSMRHFTRRIHPIIALMMIIFLYHEASAQKKQKRVASSYGAASYTVTDAATFMKVWWLAGPVKYQEGATPEPDEKTQKDFFNLDPVSQVTVSSGRPMPPLSIQNKNYEWKLNSATTDITDLDAIYNQANFAYAYALAEIKSDSSFKSFLAVGSDDGVKVWHNGKLIHNNWIGRPVTLDEDIIPIEIVKGSNQILLKVQDWSQGWGFAVRLLDRKSYVDKLVNAASRGSLDDITRFLDAGAAINGRASSGLSALDAAKIYGREEAVALLRKKGAAETTPPSGEALVDQLYKPFSKDLLSGVAVLISKGGKVIYKHGFGYADVKAKVPVTPTTKFRIGSITKQFTAAGILKLQEDGKLSVNDKLSKYFPDFPRGEEVTIHHLLTHTSGIHSYTRKGDFLEKVLKPVSKEELLAYFMKDEYDFNPGERYQYNNSGYFLLGYIIEKVSGKTYDVYLKETFFDPIRMNNTGVYTSTLKLEQEATGLTKEKNQYKAAMNWDMSWAGGAGALYSTVEDLFKWNEAVFNGKVLSKQSLDAAFTPVLLNNGNLPDGTKYGYGWLMDSYRGQDFIGHSGGLHGFVSQLARYPKENLTVVILTNITPPEAELNPNVLAQAFLWEKMEKQRSFSQMAAGNMNVKVYEGRYDFKNGAVMVITSEGENLFAQLTGQPKFPIYPSGPDEFFWKVVDARIKFEKNEKGDITHGHFEQGPYKIDAQKIPEEALVKLDPAVYKTYAGRYDYGNNLIITVTSDQGRIFAQATNQPQFEIFPVSEKEFILREINARVTFIKEPDGKVSKMIVDMAGQKKDAPRVE